MIIAMYMSILPSDCLKRITLLMKRENVLQFVVGSACLRELFWSAKWNLKDLGQRQDIPQGYSTHFAGCIYI